MARPSSRLQVPRAMFVPVAEALVRAIRFARIDALLLLMVLIWGTNYTIVKHAFGEVDPQAFNALRMSVASVVFLAIIVGVRLQRARTARGSGAHDVPAGGAIAGIFYSPVPMTRRDWLGLLYIAVVGQCAYQYLFVLGLAQTSVGNSSLLSAAAPVLIALLSAGFGHDRVGRMHWIGAVLSFTGIYIVVGNANGGGSLRGDLIMFVAVACWALFTIGARPLMTRHSPVGVTGLSMAIGTVLYVALVLPHVRAVDWHTVSRWTWISLVYSALFALCLSYTIWYAAVREIGSARTSIYSNLVPLVAIATGVMFLGEPLSGRKIAGAAAVLMGVGLTRLGRTEILIPAEE